MAHENTEGGALVTPQWLDENGSRDDVCLIEIAGMKQDDMQAYKAGHIPGAICWKWKEALWDSHMREFPDPAEFARRMGANGITNDTTVVLYGEGIQFGVYAWWVTRSTCSTAAAIAGKPRAGRFRPRFRHHGLRSNTGRQRATKPCVC